MQMERFLHIQYRQMVKEDWDAVAEIYRQGIETGNATFEVDVPDWETWNAGHIPSCRIVAVDEGIVIGWAALSRVSERCVYAGVAEVSVYVASEARGKQIGDSLLKRLIGHSENDSIWTLQAGIFPENKQSVSLHQNNGFRLVGFRERVGKLKGVWRNTLLFERRSNVAGIE